MELRRATPDGALARPGAWDGPFPSGAPAIFASVAARLGAPVALAASVGDDRFGRAIHERLERDGVDLRALRLAPGRATALAFVAYDESGGRDFWYSIHDSAASAIDGPALERLWPEVDWLHVSGSSLGFGAPMAHAIEATAARVSASGGRISLDPNLRPDADAGALARTARLAGLADVVFPSEGELAALGLATGDLVRRGALVCATHGPEGATLEGGAVGPDPVAVPAPPAREVDPTGAGDTFAAAFVAALRAGAEPVSAARSACAVAARSVEVLGAMEAPVGAAAPPAGVGAVRPGETR